MEYSGGHKGYGLKKRPKRYPRTPQQQKFLDALDHCEIKKGISKKKLMEKMTTCIPQYHEEHRK